LPLWHVGGLSIAYRAAVCGFTAVVHPSFDVGAADTALREDGVTVVSLVPTMLGRLLERGASSARYPALRVVLLGGASLSPTLARVASGAGLPLFRTYGLTEAASQVTTTEAGEAIEHPRSSGRPLEGVELRIDHPDARGRGEILVRGPQLMDGYLDDSRANDRVLAGGWLHTGDTGTIDAAGRLVVADRRADVIVSGGENVSPSEVEAVLCEHPDVVAAGVFGEPDAEWGERVGAAVVLAEGARVDARGLRDWCRERLAGFKLPRRIAIVDALPTNDSGKIRRSQLRGLVASGKA
jgi:O-succinylbenzoic acid--CoA ligase